MPIIIAIIYNSVCACFHIIILISLACSNGSYKSVQGNTDCEDCPDNSNSTSTGSTVCHCLIGYYRAVGESVSIKCTGK